MQDRQQYISKLDEAGIYPSEHLGQHILTDQSALGIFAGNVVTGGNVLEIGAGPGNITELIAERAKKVVAIEIDHQFEPALSSLRHDHPNVDVIYKDALGVNLQNIVKKVFWGSNWQIMSNLPFHITEPFLTKIVDLPITDAILILGAQMARRIQIENPDNLEFSKTGLLVQTFFDSNIAMTLPRRSFYPEPGTDSALVILTPKDSSEYRGNKKLGILRKLFLTEKKHSPVGKVIKEAYGNIDDDVVRGKEERNRYDRRQVRQELKAMSRDGIGAGSSDNYSKYNDGSRLFGRLGLSSDILNKPFSRLDNQDLRNLVSALDQI